MANQDRGAFLVRIDDLRRCLVIVFERLQLSRGDAEGLGGLLVDSELRGHPDQGVAALGVLVGFYRDGTLDPRPRMRVLRETDGAILFDETTVLGRARRCGRCAGASSVPASGRAWRWPRSGIGNSWSRRPTSGWRLRPA